jgi:ribose transport system permease protein
MSERGFFRRALAWPPLPALVLTVLFIALNRLLTPSFWNPYSMLGFLASNGPVICVAIGASIVLLGGGVDLSSGAVLSLVNVVFVSLIGMKTGFWIAAAVAVGAALAVGALNGFVVGYLRVNPLIATFATLSMTAGLALWILPTPSGSAPAGFVNFYNGFLLGIPTPVYFIVLCAVIWIVVRRTPLGLWVYAVGKNEQKAFASGLPVASTKFATFLIGGLMNGIAGLALTGSVSTGDPLIGSPVTMSAIAACVIGGVSLMGGEGDMLGAIFGGLFLGLVITLVLAAHISPFYQDLVSGLIILLGILGATWLGKKRRQLLFSRQRGSAR